MKRKFFTLIAVLSLLLCLAAAALRARSYRQQDLVRIVYGPTTAALNSARGRIVVAVFCRTDDSGLSDRPLAWEHGAGFGQVALTDLIDSTQDGAWERWGFGYVNATQFFDARMYALSMPCWFVTLVLLLPIVIFMPKRRRPAGGLCCSCGYDLRATPDRCPECGAAVPQETETTP